MKYLFIILLFVSNISLAQHNVSESLEYKSSTGFENSNNSNTNIRVFTAPNFENSSNIQVGTETFKVYLISDKEYYLGETVIEVTYKTYIPVYIRFDLENYIQETDKIVKISENTYKIYVDLIRKEKGQWVQYERVPFKIIEQ